MLSMFQSCLGSLALGLLYNFRFTHLYIVVDCKTPPCRTVHVLKHLGEKGMIGTKVEYRMSYPLMIDCPTCGKSYDYSDSEEKFWQKRASASPVCTVRRTSCAGAMYTHRG